MQGSFVSAKNSVGFLAREGVAVDSRTSVIENTFMVGVIAGYIRGAGLNDRLLLSVIVDVYASFARGVGIRALTFQLLNNLTRMVLRSLRSIRVRDGSLFRKASFRF